MSETFTRYLDQSNQPQDTAPQPDYTQGEQKGWSFKPVDFATPKDPDSQLEDLYTNAQVEARAKKRAQDMSSMDAIQADYVASVKHSQEIQDRIDQTQKMLDGTPPPRPQAGDLNTGEQLAAAIALLASHGNPFATQQIMGASQKNADQRAGESNAYNQAVYEHHRAAMLGQLQDMLAQHKAETQHGYDLKDLGLQHQSRMEEIGAQGKNQQMQVQSKSLMMAGDRANKTLDDHTSTPQARTDSMNMLETLYYETGGQMGRLFTPAERANNTDPNYYQLNIDSKTKKNEAETAFIQGPKTDIYKAHASYYGDLGRNINSEIESRRLRDRLTQAETDEIRAKIINMPAELRMKAMHAQADMIRARNSGDQPGSVKATSTWARLLDAKVKLLDAKAAKVYKQGQDLVGEWKSEKAKTDYESVMKERDAAVEEMNTSIRQVGEATKASGRPAGKTDQQLIDEANYALKHGAPKVKVQSQLEAWGVHVGP